MIVNLVKYNDLHHILHHIFHHPKLQVVLLVSAKTVDVGREKDSRVGQARNLCKYESGDGRAQND